MEITKSVVDIATTKGTPCLIMDLSIVEQNYYKLYDNVNNTQIFYAVKANPHPEIIKTLVILGSSFDVASIGELNLVLSLGADPGKVSFGNTIKKAKDIAYAYEKGVRLFVADEFSEVERIAKNAPKSKVFIRLQMSESDSDWPLTKKFGTNMQKSKEMLVLSRDLGLEPYGLSFHVGSQCYDMYIWKSALLNVMAIFDELKDEEGIVLKFINTGGGIPIQHTREIPEIEDIAEIINDTIADFFDDYEDLIVALEPGRSMVGNAGILATELIMRSDRERCEWLYIDAGVYHGLMETVQDFRYEIEIPGRTGEEELFTLSGPTCDSIDTMYDDIFLPNDIQEEDIFYVINAGAYTTGYASNFNGIEPPKTYFV